MPTENAVAVVGMACRLPGAEDVERYWAALTGGVDGITRLSPAELLARGADPDYVRRENFVPAMGVIAGSRRFDHAFFKYSPAEAAAMDPQQRVFLECAVTALDDAAFDPTRFRGRVGVYAGADRVGVHTDDELGELARYIGQEKDFLATRVAYKLGLRGPALTVQTACSTSLTALHLAVRALVGGECDAALAGGVTVMPKGEWGYLYEPGGILSPDGRCRPFDEHAAGTVPSEGVAAVVLKRLADALRDGDRIVAVIAGTAVNNDGSDKMAYTAPSITGQSEVIRAAQSIAGIDPADIDYIEAHGTATQLGDPVETQALTDVFRDASGAAGWCAIGAVKGNIGHTGVVSGVAGLIKTALMLERGQLVPTAHFTRPNPLLDLDGSPFRIAARVEPWPDRGTRLAAVSSFGVGGTNAHVLLRAAPERAPRAPRGGLKPLMLSAATPDALGRLAGALAERLEPDPADPTGPRAPVFDEVFATLARRRVHRTRAALLAEDTTQAAHLLRETSARAGALEAATAPRKIGKVAFLFPGQGTLRHGAGAAAYRRLPGFRAAFDEISTYARAKHSIDLLPVVTDGSASEAAAPDRAAPEAVALDEAAPEVAALDAVAAEAAASDKANGPGGGAAEDWFADTVHQQLGLFALGYAFGRQLLAWNIRPAALLGNSIGEYAAAALAGVWTPEDATDLVCRRAQAMWDTEPGRMVSVTAGAAEVSARLPADCGVTIAVEGAGSVVLSGPEAAVNRLLAGDVLAGLDTTPVHIRRAFHTEAMERAAEAVRATTSSMPTRPPRQPLISNATGDWADPQAVAGGDYWAAQLRRPVLLGAGMRTLLGSDCTTYIELGPGSSMLGGLRRSPGWDSGHTAVRLAPSRQGDPADAALLGALATLWELGVDRALEDVLDLPDGAHLSPGHEQPPPVCALPGYQFRGEDPEEQAPLPGRSAAVRAEVQADAPAKAMPVAPSEVRAVLEELWCRTLGVRAALEADDFFALGGESLLAVTLTTRVRERTGYAVSVTDFSRTPTFGGLVGAVERLRPTASSGNRDMSGAGSRRAEAVPGVATLAEGGPYPPLFLVCDATGTALPYRGLADQLAGSRPVFGLEDTGTARAHTVEAVAAAHVVTLLRAQPEGPYTIGGWSYGAVVAHEMARLLTRRGERLDLLVQLDGFAPDTGGLPVAFAPAFLRAGLRAQAEAALRIGPLARRMRRSPALRRQFLARQAALLRYRPRPVPCRAVLFKASSGQAEAARLRAALSGLYWGGVQVEPVGGDHWSMLAPPYVDRLAGRLLDVLPPGSADLAVRQDAADLGKARQGT